MSTCTFKDMMKKYLISAFEWILKTQERFIYFHNAISYFRVRRCGLERGIGYQARQLEVAEVREISNFTSKSQV